VWIEVPRGTETRWETLPPLDQLDVPRRGKALRDAIILRLIAVDRAVHAVLFGLIAAALIALELNLGTLKADARSLSNDLTRLVADTGRNPSRDFIGRQLRHVLDLKSGSLRVLAATAVVYCVVEAVEAVGLWRERRWAEYLTALATAGFLPFEVHELARRVTVLRVGALVVNLAILVWLVWSKRLFGIRGGERADEEAIARDERLDVWPGSGGR
jgi:uncharacterized membrane protein (DUF2068 family)